MTGCLLQPDKPRQPARSKKRAHAARVRPLAVAHQAQRAREGRQPGVELHQRAGGQRIGHHAARQAAEPQARGHGALDGLGVAQFHVLRQLAQMLQQPMLDLLARAAAGFAQQPGRGRQLRARGTPAGERVVWRRDHHQLVLPPRGHAQLGVLASAFDEAEIDIHGSHRRRHARRVADRAPHGRARVGAAKARQLGRHQVAGDGGAGTQAQRQRAAGQQRLTFLGLTQQRLRARQQQAAVFVEHQPAPMAIEQALAKRLLQPCQRLAGGRLGQVHGIGGAADVVVAGHGTEHLQLAQGEAQRHID